MEIRTEENMVGQGDAPTAKPGFLTKDFPL